MSPKTAPKAALLLSLALAGCDVKIREGKASMDMVSAEATDEWTHQYPLSVGGLVEIVNFGGAVIMTQGTGNTVEVHALAKARTLTDAGARDILTKAKIQEVSQPDLLHIETVMPRGIHGSYIVNYDVRVPPGSRTDVSTTNGTIKMTALDGKAKATAINGKVELQDIRGSIDSVVANGSLTAHLSRITAPVRLEITNGSMILQMPSDSKVNLSARVINGTLGVSGLTVDQPTGRRIRTLEALLNGGGPEVSARVTNGRLSIEGK